jgi:hypothetical protein
VSGSRAAKRAARPALGFPGRRPARRRSAGKAGRCTYPDRVAPWKLPRPDRVRAPSARRWAHQRAAMKRDRFRHTDLQSTSLHSHPVLIPPGRWRAKHLSYLLPGGAALRLRGIARNSQHPALPVPCRSFPGSMDFTFPLINPARAKKVRRRPPRSRNRMTSEPLQGGSVGPARWGADRR